MGAQGVQLLLDPDHAPGEHLVPMPLRVRGSVKLPDQVASRIDVSEEEPNWVR